MHDSNLTESELQSQHSASLKSAFWTNGKDEGISHHIFSQLNKEVKACFGERVILQMMLEKLIFVFIRMKRALFRNQVKIDQGH